MSKFSNRRLIESDDEQMIGAQRDEEEVIPRVSAPLVMGPKVALKFLVSNNLAGGLIGRKGAEMHALQTETGARIRVSGATDLFPGTQDRVCLVTGAESAVVHASNLIVGKAAEVRSTNLD